MAKRVPGATVRAAVIGYGMGRLHAEHIAAHPELELKAICDADPARAAQAKKDHPDADTYANMGPVLRRKDIDLVTVVTPHNVHCKHVVQCLRVGKHVIVEKPMCLNVREADRMIAAARQAGRLFTCYQNRRLDGDFMTILEVVRDGLIGDVFQVDVFGGGYHKPRANWRSDQKVCGGALYDWGAHFVDWVLNLVPAPIVNVTGFVHKLVWDFVTLEDQARVLIRFANGCVADITNSRIDMVGRERWRILGTRGGITLGPGNTLRVRTRVQDYNAELSVPCKESRWPDYYANIADHLLRGKALLVRPEESRRAIGVIESIAKSARLKKSIPVPYK
jgi:predicted dehydrogenase